MNRKEPATKRRRKDTRDGEPLRENAKKFNFQDMKMNFGNYEVWRQAAVFVRGCLYVPILINPFDHSKYIQWVNEQNSIIGRSACFVNCLVYDPVTGNTRETKKSSRPVLIRLGWMFSVWKGDEAGKIVYHDNLRDFMHVLDVETEEFSFFCTPFELMINTAVSFEDGRLVTSNDHVRMDLVGPCIVNRRKELVNMRQDGDYICPSAMLLESREVTGHPPVLIDTEIVSGSQRGTCLVQNSRGHYIMINVDNTVIVISERFQYLFAFDALFLDRPHFDNVGESGDRMLTLDPYDNMYIQISGPQNGIVWYTADGKYKNTLSLHVASCMQFIENRLYILKLKNDKNVLKSSLVYK